MPEKEEPAPLAKDPAIAAMSPDDRYELALAQLAGLAALKREQPGLDFSRFGKDGATVALYVPESLLSHGTDSSKRCRRVVFEVHRENLSSEVPTNGGEGRPKLAAPAHFQEIVLDRHVTTFATASRSVERNEKGERVEVGQAVGGFEQHGGELLDVRDDALAYGAIPVGVRAICVHITEQPCRGGNGLSACERCTKLDAALESRAPRYGFGHAGAARQVMGGVTADGPMLSCSACPADTLTPEIPRISQALEGMTFYTTTSAPWPVISRKKAPCEAAERTRVP